MKKLFLGILLGLSMPFIVAYIFLIAGAMPVATKGPPLPLEKLIAKISLSAAIGADIHKPSPIATDELNLKAGANIYMQHCAVCHDDLNHHVSAIAKGLFPKPPRLIGSDHGVTDDPVGESYWKIKNGIRLTGMPGFVDSLTETELWQVSQLVAHADKLSESVAKLLKK